MCGATPGPTGEFENLPYIGPIVVGIKHIIGGREWAALLKK